MYVDVAAQEMIIAALLWRLGSAPLHSEMSMSPEEYYKG